MSSTRHKVVPGAVLAMTVAATLVGSPAHAEDPVPFLAPVDPGVVLQDDFQGFGTSLAWWADVVGDWSEPRRTQMLDLLFADSAQIDGSTVPGLSLDVVRYNAGASEPGVQYPVVDPHLPERHGAWIESLVRADGTYDWSADAAQRRVLGEAAARGATTFELFANSAPWWMTYSGHPAGRYSHNSPEGCQHSNLRPEYQGAFADYLATVAERFGTIGIDGPGSPTIDFETIEPFNEPSNGWWCWGNNQEGTYLTADEQSAIVGDLRAALDVRSMGTGIAATDSNNYWGVVSEFDALTEEARDALSQVNAHGYAGSDPEPIRDRAEARDLRFWQSEWGPAGWGGYDITSELDAGLELATRVTNDLSYVEANAWLYWQAVEDSTRGDGPGFWGLVQATLDGTQESFDLQKQYFMLGQYSRFIEPGDLVIDSGNGKTVAAYDPDEDRLVLVTYNDQSAPMPLTYDLSRFDVTGSTVQSWRTSATEELASVTAPTLTGDQMATTVPPGAVVTYVLDDVTADTASATAEVVNDSVGFRYDGAWSETGYSGAGAGAYGLWDQDEHAAQSAGATAQYTFHGTGVSIFGTRAPTSGKVAFSVDGGAEEVVNLYQDARFDGAHLWSSGALQAGAHTVTVRVLGEAGAPGGGSWGNIDRAVVTDAGWTACADTGQTCAVDGPSEVRLVTTGSHPRAVVADDVVCETGSFDGGSGSALGCVSRPVASASLVAAHSGQCLGVADSSASAEAEVVQWPCIDNADQRLRVVPTAGGLQLQPAHVSGMCLDADAEGRVLQQPCGSGDGTTWTLSHVRDGYYAVRDTADGACLDVPGASHEDGKRLITYACNSYPNQLWKLAEPSA